MGLGCTIFGTVLRSRRCYAGIRKAPTWSNIPELSTYLGHVKVSDTYWYLSATPELLQLALQRSEEGDTHDR